MQPHRESMTVRFRVREGGDDVAQDEVDTTYAAQVMCRKMRVFERVADLQEM